MFIYNYVDLLRFIDLLTKELVGGGQHDNKLLVLCKKQKSSMSTDEKLLSHLF